jgi:site-specific DNA-methyltransferase (adenine-specific)
MVKIMIYNEATKLFNNSKPLIWDKVNMGMGYHWRCRHEYVVMLDKGKRRLNDLGKSDILTHKKVKGYPTQKPVGLYEELLLNSTNEGDTILDPFCGSGTLGEACQKNNRNGVLVDISDRAIQLSKERIRKEV